MTCMCMNKICLCACMHIYSYPRHTVTVTVHGHGHGPDRDRGHGIFILATHPHTEMLFKKPNNVRIKNTSTVTAMFVALQCHLCRSKSSHTHTHTFWVLRIAQRLCWRACPDTWASSSIVAYKLRSQFKAVYFFRPMKNIGFREHVSTLGL
jgi:hypothetical protein